RAFRIDFQDLLAYLRDLFICLCCVKSFKKLFDVHHLFSFFVFLWSIRSLILPSLSYRPAEASACTCNLLQSCFSVLRRACCHVSRWISKHFPLLSRICRCPKKKSAVCKYSQNGCFRRISG